MKYTDINKAQLAQSLSAFFKENSEALNIPDTPLYPLAFHVPMPEDFAFDNGHVSFGFSDFNLKGLDKLVVTGDDEGKLTVTFPELALEAAYDLQSKYAHKVEMDIGGNLMPLNRQETKEAGADDSNQGYPSPTQDEVNAWTGQARDQRPQVQNTHHGPTLLNSYNQHNDSYNDVFILNPGLQKTWSSYGTTAQMSRDTHQAINDGSKINENKYKTLQGGFEVELDYNTISIMQQASLAAGCYYVAQNKLTGQRAEDMHAAGAASLDFKNTLQNNLGVSPDVMSPKEVYDALNNPNFNKPAEVSMNEFKNHMEQGTSQDGGAAATEEAKANGWKILTEEEREQIREHMYTFYLEDALARDEHPQTLYNGKCRATLNSTRASVVLSLSGEGKGYKVKDVETTLPAFALELEDSHWTGKTAEMIRERLTQIHFVKSLIQHKLEAGISKVLNTGISNALA